MQRAQRQKNRVGLLFLDLDRFKTVNDSLGHSTGDLLLRDVSQRLRGRVRESDTIGRLGGDEFLVVLEELVTTEDPAGVARALLTTLEDPFALPQGREVYISASIGISLYAGEWEHA
jgi:diguanylate cyclase (GGDEF)-like protein